MGALTALRFTLAHPLNQGARLAALARYVRWQVSSRIALGPILVDFVDSMKLVVAPGMHGATHNIYCGLHEFEDMAFTLHLLREGDLFIDVGANIGSYTILASAARADVVAFEPGERFDDLVRNVRVNGLDVRCHKMAIGDRAGQLKFTIGLDCTNRAATHGEDFVEVPVSRLDDIIHASPTLIKVDVEGFESAVLTGGERTFAASLAVIIEINGQTARYGRDESHIHCQMRGWGFELVGYDPWTRSLVPPLEKSNKIFVRGDISEKLRTAPKYRVGNHLI